MRRTNTKQFNPDPLNGDQPEDLYGSSAPDGDGAAGLVNFKRAPIGSTYWKQVTANQHELYLKVKNDQRDDDWVLLQGVISQRLTKSDFTDGGAAAGTKVLNATIPLGAYFEKTLISNVTAFSGDTSAVVTVGDGTDVDRYNTGTPSLFTTGTAVSAGVPSGTRDHDAAISTVTVTVTSAIDFTAVASTGAVTLTLFYYGSVE